MVMGYQNRNCDICYLTKKGFGSKNFLGPGPGACKVRPLVNLSISKIGCFFIRFKIRGPKSRIGSSYGL